MLTILQKAYYSLISSSAAWGKTDGNTMHQNSVGETSEVFLSAFCCCFSGTSFKQIEYVSVGVAGHPQTAGLVM